MSNFKEICLQAKIIRNRMNALAQPERSITTLVSNLEAAIRPSVQKESVKNASITVDSQGSKSQQEGPSPTPVKNFEATVRMNLQRNNSTSVNEITEYGDGSGTKADNLESVSSKNSDNLEFVSGVQRDNLKSGIIERTKLVKTEKEGRKVTIRGPFFSSEKISYLFQPRVLSIGPVHAGLTNFQFMESMKWEFLGFLSENQIANCVDRIRNHEKLARGCYVGSIGLSSDEFVQMLLRDSISIIFLIMAEVLDLSMLFARFVFEDMLRLQNQIPFFIILEIWEELGVDMDFELGVDTDFATVLRSTSMFKDASFDNLEEINHLLDLFYKCNIPIPARVSKPQTSNWFLLCMPSWFLSWFSQPQTQEGDRGTILSTQSATELYEAGVKFKPKTDAINFLDISFENGILQIPTLILNTVQMSLLANLLIHEIANTGLENLYVINHVNFMDSLINTKKDIALLEKFGVIDNKLSTDDEAANFIKSLGECIGSLPLDVVDNPYAPMIQDIMKFVASSWRRNWTSLNHTYFSNPWTGISVLAGCSLLILAFVQTFYTAYPYLYHHIY